MSTTSYWRYHRGTCARLNPGAQLLGRSRFEGTTVDDVGKIGEAPLRRYGGEERVELRLGDSLNPGPIQHEDALGDRGAQGPKGNFTLWEDIGEA